MFRGVIPPIAGFDLSVLPAFFLLDILSQTAVAIGEEIPKEFDRKKSFIYKLQMERRVSKRD